MHAKHRIFQVFTLFFAMSLLITLIAPFATRAMRAAAVSYYTHIGYRLSFLKSWNFKESKLTSANWCFVSVSARHVSIARLKSAKFS